MPIREETKPVGPNSQSTKQTAFAVCRLPFLIFHCRLPIEKNALPTKIGRWQTCVWKSFRYCSEFAPRLFFPRAAVSHLNVLVETYIVATFFHSLDVTRCHAMVLQPDELFDWGAVVSQLFQLPDK